MADTISKSPDIDDVRSFWDANPLWTGESAAAAGTREFFEEHRRTVYRDCFAGTMDPLLFSDIDRSARILDLGCGIGFWLMEFWERGFVNLTGADLSPRSLAVARQRCSVYGVSAELCEQNAERMTFATASFDHVNCQGVVHHTVSPPAAMREICRVLKPGGTACVSVYFKNIALRQWKLFRPLSKTIAMLGGGLKGRGREDILARDDSEDIVRRYDGDANPIGRAYDRNEFRALIGEGFDIERTFFHFFPARAMPFALPHAVHSALDRAVPFMIFARLRKR